MKSQLVSEVLRSQRAREKQEAKELLLKNRSELEKSVEKIREFSYFELADSKLGGGNVERILSFKFNDVDSAIWKNRTKESATILFSLKCDLKLLVGPSLWNSFNTRYQVGGGRVMMTPGNTQPEEKIIEKTVFGVAEFAKEGEELRLKRLETDQSLPTEDLVQLMATE